MSNTALLEPTAPVTTIKTTLRPIDRDGLLAFADLMGVWTYYHLYKGYFNPEKLQFKYMGLR